MSNKKQISVTSVAVMVFLVPIGIVQRRRDDNENKICDSEGGGG